MLYIQKIFNNKDIFDFILISKDNNTIKLKEELNKVFFYFLLNEELNKIFLNKNNLENFIKNNEKLIENIYFDFLDKFISKNVFLLKKEFYEYKIFEGYEEIISLLIFEIKNEDLNYIKENGKLILTRKLKRKINLKEKKIKKFLLNKIKK